MEVKGEAQEIKRSSDFVVDAIVAEDVGKLPDNSVAEALARVTGIQIRRDAGEANSVLIRGLPNVVTLLNGREVFTTTGGRPCRSTPRPRGTRRPGTTS